MCMMSGKESFDYAGCALQVRQHNIVLVSVHFRNSTEAAYPAGLNDCVACVKWVAENAESLGVDMSAGGVTLYGPSGGGNLVIATSMRLKGSGIVNGVIANCPATAGWEDEKRYP